MHDCTINDIVLCNTWGVNYFLHIVWSIGLPLELNSVISGFHSKSGTSVHFHCKSCIFHPEPCSTFNVHAICSFQFLYCNITH